MNILLILLGAVTLFLGVRLFLRRAPRYGQAFLVRLLIIGAVIAVIALAMTGRLHWLLGLLAGLLPFMRRLLPLLLPLLRFLPFVQQARSEHKRRQKSQGQRSEVATAWLRMVLDHDSGEIDGEVLAGPFTGRRLETLSLNELQQLYALCREQDPESLRLLDAYIQRYHADSWDESERSPPPQQASSGMSPEEAWEILGLSPGASREEIIQAHKRMMLRVHPDRGGSNYLATKINQAKEVLLAHQP